MNGRSTYHNHERDELEKFIRTTLDERLRELGITTQPDALEAA